MVSHYLVIFAALISDILVDEQFTVSSHVF